MTSEPLTGERLRVMNKLEILMQEGIVPPSIDVLFFHFDVREELRKRLAKLTDDQVHTVLETLENKQ